MLAISTSGKMILYSESNFPRAFITQHDYVVSDNDG